MKPSIFAYIRSWYSVLVWYIRNRR